MVEEGKGLVVAVNKWDLVEEKTDRTFDQYVVWIRDQAPFLEFAPIVSISAQTGQRVGKVLELAVDIWGERRRRVPTGELNRLLATATERVPPALARGRRPKLFYATQAAVAPPTFVFFASDASSVHFSYRRYLENRLREAFGFHGTPIKLVFRDRAKVRAPRRRSTRSGRAAQTARKRPVRSRPPADGSRVAADDPVLDSLPVGAWRSLVAHQSGGLVVVGSNPAAPTKHQARNRHFGPVFVARRWYQRRYQQTRSNRVPVADIKRRSARGNERSAVDQSCIGGSLRCPSLRPAPADDPCSGWPISGRPRKSASGSGVGGDVEQRLF